MRYLIVICLFFALGAEAQDKIFLKDGAVKQGVILSMGADFVFFKQSDTSARTFKIPKQVIVMIEKYDGKVFIYADKPKTDILLTLPDIKRNSLGIQPLNLFTGRFTLVYERLNKQGTVGFCPVVSLSFDPVGSIYKTPVDTSRGRVIHNGGINFIGGADVNFYLGKGENAKFFMGPRLRYGVDMFLRNIEAYSVQTQFGWRFCRPACKFTQHLSIGLGFVRILSSQAGNRISPKQAYGWGSINYRIGVNW